jgi:CO/xanthine dehydrogenase Mo-binding subunit
VSAHDHRRTAVPDIGVLDALRAPEERVEGRAKVTGSARYAADVSRPGMLWAAFLGSPVPHARIRAVNASAARSMPGVHAVLTGADVEGRFYGRRLRDRPVLCWDRARFVGDRIAAVAAETPEQAAAAAAAIELDLEELPALLDVDAALAEDAVILHPDAAAYAYVDGERKPVPHPNVQGRVAVRRGADDLDAVFASAAHVVEQVFRTPRMHAGYLEPHATLVWLDDAGVLQVVTTNKTPYPLRKQLAATLEIPADRVNVDAGFIGGDFGGKGYTPDEFACAFLARATGRPIKVITRMADELSTQNVRHASVARLRTAVDADGQLLAHDARILLDGGAYASAKPLPHLSLSGGVATLAGYRVPNARIEAFTVYTNGVPGGHTRTPGEVQALFAGESHLDTIARELGEDPLAFRLRNAVRQGDHGAAGEHYVEARAVEVLQAAAGAIDWAAPRPRGRGRGIAMSARHVGGGKLPLRLRLHADGTVEVPIGLPDQGAGGSTVIRRVVAAAASIAEDRVRVVKVPTADGPFDPGVGGSRITHLGSRAAQSLGVQLRDWLLERLPGAIPAATQTTELRDDAFVDLATGRTVASFAEVAGVLVPDGSPVELSTVYEPEAHGPDEPGDFDFGACAVEVEVDEETGAVRVTDAVLAVDVGTVINPTAHLGQLEGGFVFGLGAALMEELPSEGGAITALSLADFKLPTAGDAPPLRVVQIPTAEGPGAFGAKMAGELTNAPVPPAVANAIADAVGVRICELPLTAERVRAAIERGGSTR